MSEKSPLYDSPGEKGKRGFDDLECYRLALQGKAKVHVFSKALPADEKYDWYARIRRASKGVTTNSLYKLIRQADQALNGSMTDVRRQRAGSESDGDKRMSADPIYYDPSSLEEESD